MKTLGIFVMSAVLLLTAGCKSRPDATTKDANKGKKTEEIEFEVKFNLNAATALSGESKLSPTVNKLLNIKDDPISMQIRFVDDDDANLRKAGWSIRIRERSDRKEADLTYKRRYPVTDDDLNATVVQAENDGSDSSMKHFVAQIDWSYRKQTLSFSRGDSIALGKINLLSTQELREFVLKNKPNKLDQSGIPNLDSIFANATAYGPIPAKRWMGRWHDKKISVEVWDLRRMSSNVPGGFVVEASFKEDSSSKAAQLRQKLMDDLRDASLLVEDDLLKTEMVFAN